MMAAKKIRFIGCLPKRKVARLELGILARSSSSPAKFTEYIPPDVPDVHRSVRITG
jgi:hypothetical protein